MFKNRTLLTLLTLVLALALVLPSFGSINSAAAQEDRQYNEAPMLAAKVAAGELPPVEERLPVNPRVVEPIDSIGEYGGIWDRAWRGINDFHAFGRIIYDPVLRWPLDPTGNVEPGLA